MDRRLRYGLLGVGLFLLLFALIERAYAYPRLAKVPLGVYLVPVAEGIGSYFDTSRLEMVRGARLRTTRVVKGDRGRAAHGSRSGTCSSTPSTSTPAGASA